MTNRTEDLLAFCEALDSVRRPWESFWDDLAKVCHPRRRITANQYAQQSTPENETTAETDSTAMRSLRILAQGQSARITPMGARWFGLKPETMASQSATAYFQRAAETIAQQMRKSNFYQACHEHYLDRGAFGTAATEVRAGKNDRGLHFEAYPVGTYSIAEDENGEVDTICRTMWLTPVQIMRLYSGNVPESVAKKSADPKDRLIPLEVKRLIMPRLDRNPTKADKRNKAFASYHILVSEKHLLSEDGFDEFPVAVSRWEKWGNTPWGWPPAYMALSESRQATFLEQMLDTLAEVAAYPRVLYPSNIKGDVDYKALGLTCYDPANGHTPKEWLTGGRYDIGKDRLEDKREAIEEAFFVPLFNAIGQLGSDATAEQVRALVSESRELFHPILANLTREFLSPIIRRSFAILMRQGLIGMPPEDLIQQGDLGAFMEDPGVEFTSPMALALEQSQLANFADAVAVMTPLAQTDPSVFDFIDTARVGPAFFRYKGLPEEFIRTEKEIAAIQQARMQAAQAEQAQQAAGTVQKLGGAQGIQDLSGMLPPEMMQ